MSKNMFFRISEFQNLKEEIVIYYNDFSRMEKYILRYIETCTFIVQRFSFDTKDECSIYESSRPCDFEITIKSQKDIKKLKQKIGVK